MTPADVVMRFLGLLLLSFAVIGCAGALRMRDRDPAWGQYVGLLAMPMVVFLAMATGRCP